MADRPNLRVLDGGRCPTALVPSLEREMVVRLEAIVAELRKFVSSASFDLDDDELCDRLSNAVADVQLAQLALARRRRP